jgi:hypothetical protein
MRLLDGFSIFHGIHFRACLWHFFNHAIRELFSPLIFFHAQQISVKVQVSVQPPRCRYYGVSLPRFRPYLCLATKLTRDFTSEFLRFLHGREFMRFRVVALVSELQRVVKSRTTEMEFAKKQADRGRGEREGEKFAHTHTHVFPCYRLDSRSTCLSRGNLANRRFIPCGVDAFVLIVIN